MSSPIIPEVHFSRPDGKPLSEGHHISKNPRGKYVLKVTVDRGEKFTGERITLPLRTTDAGLAMAKRDAVLEAYKRLGVLCRDIILTEEM